jgi:hypothetical protein
MPMVSFVLHLWMALGTPLLWGGVSSWRSVLFLVHVFPGFGSSPLAERGSFDLRLTCYPYVLLRVHHIVSKIRLEEQTSPNLFSGPSEGPWGGLRKPCRSIIVHWLSGCTSWTG